MKSTETESRSLRSAGRVAGLHGTETKSDAVHSRRSDGNARSDDKISPIHCIRSLPVIVHGERGTLFAHRAGKEQKQSFLVGCYKSCLSEVKNTKPLLD